VSLQQEAETIEQDYGNMNLDMGFIRKCGANLTRTCRVDQPGPSDLLMKICEQNAIVHTVWQDELGPL